MVRRADLRGGRRGVRPRTQGGSIAMHFPTRLVAGLVVSLSLLTGLRAEPPAAWRAWDLPAVQPLPEGARLRLGSGGIILKFRDQAVVSSDSRYLALADEQAGRKPARFVAVAGPGCDCSLVGALRGRS